MLPFFKKNQKEQLQMEGQDAPVSSKELLEESAESEAKSVEPQLSVHPEWKIPEEDMYAFRFLHNECEPLLPNQVSLSGMNMQEDNGTFTFNAFVRHSINKKLKLEDAVIIIMDEDNRVLGRKTFDLRDLGELPPNASRPWQFTFTPKDLFTEEIPQTGWKLAFQLQPSSRKHTLDLSDSWKRSLAQEARQKLTRAVNDMEAPKPGEVNFMGLKAQFAEDALHVTLLIRNGGEKNINIEQLPLEVTDAEGDIIASGGFKLDPPLQVKSNTSKPWNFVFHSSSLKKENPDLSRWKAYPPKKENKSDQ
ncbi:accessory Sec system S-layer assembly protein [Alkalicoccus chagannorensis]|uniref:accessory Sec system S-layer assembly protein n=1 Tax=Alkalicoccus chagannorensis TaxID=427072 RepID=UPI0003FEF769|nr:accessory Sec system S-layer assembly protein [Alkalicoccus chagannorensis]